MKKKKNHLKFEQRKLRHGVYGGVGRDQPGARDHVHGGRTLGRSERQDDVGQEPNGVGGNGRPGGRRPRRDRRALIVNDEQHQRAQKNRCGHQPFEHPKAVHFIVVVVDIAWPGRIRVYNFFFFFF